jgi:hypothetical protein
MSSGGEDELTGGALLVGQTFFYSKFLMYLNFVLIQMGGDTRFKNDHCLAGDHLYLCLDRGLGRFYGE